MAVSSAKRMFALYYTRNKLNKSMTDTFKNILFVNFRNCENYGNLKNSQLCPGTKYQKSVRYFTSSDLM